MLTLFHAPRSRSTRMIWLLEELGAPYEIRKVDIVRQGGVGARDAANPHPHGQVPAIVDDGVLITESAAIALYLTDKFREHPMGPAVGDPLRGPYLTWLAYYAGVLEPVITARFQGRAEETRSTYDTMDAQLTGALANGPWLLGESFSAADILFISLLQFARQALPPHAAYDDWLARAQARPALARALQKDDA
jgi:glutathione S-transferase